MTRLNYLPPRMHIQTQLHLYKSMFLEQTQANSLPKLCPHKMNQSSMKVHAYQLSVSKIIGLEKKMLKGYLLNHRQSKTEISPL